MTVRCQVTSYDGPKAVVGVEGNSLSPGVLGPPYKGVLAGPVVKQGVDGNP